MPDVHLRGVEHVAKRPERELHVGVIEVPNHDRNDVNRKELLDTEPQETEGDVLERSIHHRFEPVVAKVCRETHFAHRVVNLVAFPQERNAVQQAVDPVVDEVAGDEHHQQLEPHGPRADVCAHERVEAHCCACIREYRFDRARDGVVAEQ